ncbi:hypothetical protein FH608_042310 [Nonomuraea phyllanthi]|uniref:Uncharacterized protein n=1 Tax=Nonomuraea phyllanthi TaxID=2219224 RepID=A0A5C4VG04_9ACTN|nr:hypothetical protein [Nonomuraea phyllanthi]KAB8188724.1 hypothetical protein FH608_042310 [Nonomuraea phyllanthi]QFY05917.1 hypothetical protein GBF35_03845 [Nonomuraea phyllanthi]
MDVEAEILELRRRVEALETIVRSGLGPRQPGAVPAQAGPRPRDVPVHVSETSIGLAELKAEVADVRTEVSQDFEALIVELAGLRAQTNENVRSAQSEILGKLDSLRCEMIDLALRLDRLLEINGP